MPPSTATEGSREASTFRRSPIAQRICEMDSFDDMVATLSVVQVSVELALAIIRKRDRYPPQQVRDGVRIALAASATLADRIA